MATIEERATRYATRNYYNSDGEVVESIVDQEVKSMAMTVANTIQKETIEKACIWIKENLGNYVGEGGWNIIDCDPECDTYMDVVARDLKKALEGQA